MAGHSADVKSLGALDELARSLRKFQEEANVAFDELNMEIHRAVEWIQHDAKHYWNQQVRRAEQQVTEAKIALERKQMFRVADRRPSCYDEKKALELARRRLALAREKVETVRRWSLAISQIVMEYKGDVGPLTHWVEAELPRAIALIHRQSGALDSYVDRDMGESEDESKQPAPATAAAAEDSAEPEDPAGQDRNSNDETMEPDDGRDPA